MSDPAAPRLPRLVCVGKTGLPQPFGDEQQLSALYAAVAEHCERLDVIGLSATADAGHAEVWGKIHVHAGPRAGGLRGHWEFLRHAFRTVRALERSIQPDLYWTMDPFDSALPAWYARRLGRAPVVVQILGDVFRFSPARFNWAKRLIIRSMATWATGWAARVRVISHDMLEQLVARGVPREKIAYVTHRVDFGVFEPTAPAEPGRALRTSHGWDDQLVAIYTGAMNATKGTDLLVAALVALRDELPQLRLLVLGTGPQQAALEQTVAAAGIADRVKFVGWIPYNDLPTWYAAADFSVVPSRDEGLGRGAIQAAGVGRPSIVTRVGGNPEVLVDGETGWLADPTVASLTDALRRVAATTPAERREMGERGRQFVVERYSFEPVVQCMIEELLERVVREHPRPDQPRAARVGG